ncbi:hypothetical protein ElyMa_003038300 [Elysia marginata]|uniref:Uncharacterized protein n=1 Tax=Elysia marginata TaxID=1093978 RepID=A0AAV4IL35_9GAST|nr:hypothetical protein ElyMa_003038300 [Elysia marginata]
MALGLASEGMAWRDPYVEGQKRGDHSLLTETETGKRGQLDLRHCEVCPLAVTGLFRRQDDVDNNDNDDDDDDKDDGDVDDDDASRGAASSGGLAALGHWAGQLVTLELQLEPPPFQPISVEMTTSCPVAKPRPSPRPFSALCQSLPSGRARHPAPRFS